MTHTPIVAVTGATGAQGSAIAERFAIAGWQVRALSRRGAAAARHPAITPWATPDPAALQAALDGAAALAVTLPIDNRPGVREAWLEQLLAVAARARVARLVLNLAARPLPVPGLRMSETLRAMEPQALGGPVPATVLRPTMYLENLLQPQVIGAARDQGVLAYPLTEAVRVAWISHRTLGDAAVAAAALPGAAGRGFDIGGPAPLTITAIATALGRALGRQVGFVPMATSDFAAAINAAFGAPNGDDIGDFYARLALMPEALAGAPGNEALGIEAEGLEAWLARQAFGA